MLNQSAPGGSASTVAARVRSRGWAVGRVDDFHGNVSTTTVYYPPGLHSEARDLADDLSGSPRVQEAFNTISDTRLTVILVDLTADALDERRERRLPNPVVHSRRSRGNVSAIRSAGRRHRFRPMLGGGHIRDRCGERGVPLDASDSAATNVSHTQRAGRG